MSGKAMNARPAEGSEQPGCPRDAALRSLAQPDGVEGLLWPMLIVLAAAASRLWDLERFSLSGDEAFSLVFADVPIALAWKAMIVDAVHPPLYYLVLRGGLALLGRTEFALRFPSVLFGILAVPLLFALARRLTGRRGVALLAASLLALSPLHTWYSQDARMYALYVCLVLATTWLFIRLVQGQAGPSADRRRTLHWGALVVVSALAYCTHYFALFLPLVQFVFLAMTLRQHHRLLRIWVIAQVLAFAPLALWLAAVYGQGELGFGVGWIPTPGLWDVFITLWNFSVAWSGEMWPWAIGVGLMLGALAFGVLSWRSVAADGPEPSPVCYENMSARQTRLWLVLWLFAPLFLSLALSAITPLYVDRFMLLTLPAYLLLVAWGALSVRAQAVRLFWAGAILACTFVALLHVHSSSAFAREDWRGLARYLEQASRPADVIVLRYFQYKFPFEYYYRGPARLAVLTVNTATGRLEDLARGHERLWLIYRLPNQSGHALRSSFSLAWDRDEENADVRAWLAVHVDSVFEETARFASLHLLGFDIN